MIPSNLCLGLSAPYCPFGLSASRIVGGPFGPFLQLLGTIAHHIPALLVEELSLWYGIHGDAVRSLLDELVRDGIVRAAPGRGDGYVLNEEPVAATFLPLQSREFVCARCHLIKHRRQLRDGEWPLCQDCV